MEQAKASTKDKILNLLKREAALSVNDLTDRLQITHMAIRKHLNGLEKGGLIQSREVKQPMGRPLQSYSLTERGEKLFPKNYEGITIEFLHDLKELHGEAAIDLLFSKREQRLTKEYVSKIKGPSNHDRIKELLAIQNEKGYMANLSQITPHTYELVEHNCPILSIANEFKIACSCETQLLKNVLQTDEVKRVTCKTDGDYHCKFIIKFE